MTPEIGLFRIVATHVNTGELVECFTWQGPPYDGIARAKTDAQKSGMDGLLKDYRAQPLNMQRCIGCGD